MDSTVVAGALTAGTTLVVGLVLNRGQKKIEVKVDGRLEAALQKIDGLEEHLSEFTGKAPPPPVAGQSGITQ